MYGTLIILVLVVLFVFLVFSIMRVAFKQPSQMVQALPVRESMYDVPYKESLEPVRPQQIPAEVMPKEPPVRAPVREQTIPVPQPEVPGQTKEELNAPEPLQERASQKVDPPSATDPYDNIDNEAQFGSNLRHPESMIAKSGAKFAALETEVAAGVAGRPEVEQLPFSAEMAQNGGEFMKGIFAFDTSDSGTNFSAY